jgi:hypothetical protein
MKTWSFTPGVLAFSLLGLPAMTGCSLEVAAEADEGPVGEAALAIARGPGYIKAKGAFTCDFRLAGDYPQNEVAPDLERDRMLMSPQPGIQQKHIPISLDFTHFTNGNPDLLSGGRYLIDTWQDARRYEHFVEEEYSLGGLQFFERPRFFDPECHAFKVIGAYDFSDIHTTQVIVRTERFTMPPASAGLLKQKWNAIHAEAGARGFASVWLLYNDIERIASVVYYHDRIVPRDPSAPDFASLGYVEGSTPLGHHIAELGWPRTFDRTSWVFTIWHPFVPGDHGEPSEWPHSPPFALPGCGDGVCEPSRGESNASCSADCVVGCGDAICRPDRGESYVQCPGDCDPNNRSQRDCNHSGRN